jgi:FkbM family methyltransferase
MTLYQNTKIGLRYKRWTAPEAIAYFVKGVARELHIAPAFFLHLYEKVRFRAFARKWLKHDGGVSCFDICGAKLPDISGDREKMSIICRIFEDTFLIPACYNDNYQKSLVETLDKVMLEGPYGYTDGLLDVTVKKGDVVIDAGAWIGDFSAYAVSKGATVYAFEPVKEIFQWLCQTQSLNCSNGEIHPVQKGLSSSEGEVNISINEGNSGSSSIVTERRSDKMETISVTTLDKFVKENKLERVDFIKADIEGAERDMLKGATHVLKTFAPKLAICTYHLPDDPEILEKIIRDANPAYTVVQLRHKLFAAVV